MNNNSKVWVLFLYPRFVRELFIHRDLVEAKLLTPVIWITIIERNVCWLEVAKGLLSVLDDFPFEISMCGWILFVDSRTYALSQPAIIAWPWRLFFCPMLGGIHFDVWFMLTYTHTSPEAIQRSPKLKSHRLKILLPAGIGVIVSSRVISALRTR